MSLFAMLKYGSTNLGNVDDLLILPEDLLDNFYEEVHRKECFTTNGSDNSKLMKCAVMANVYKKWYYMSEFDKNGMQKIFKGILIEYECKE